MQISIWVGLVFGLRVPQLDKKGKGKLKRLLIY